MLHRGEAEKVGRGLYRRGSEVTELDTVAMVCARVPRAVACLLTALVIHRIGTQLPADVWIALDRKARKPRVEDLPIRIVRFSPAMLRYGIEERRIHGVLVRMTSPARTVVRSEGERPGAGRGARSLRRGPARRITQRAEQNDSANFRLAGSHTSEQPSP